MSITAENIKTEIVDKLIKLNLNVHEKKIVFDSFYSLFDFIISLDVNSDGVNTTAYINNLLNQNKINTDARVENMIKVFSFYLQDIEKNKEVISGFKNQLDDYKNKNDKSNLQNNIENNDNATNVDNQNATNVDNANATNVDNQNIPNNITVNPSDNNTNYCSNDSDSAINCICTTETNDNKQQYIKFLTDVLNNKDKFKIPSKIYKEKYNTLNKYIIEGLITKINGNNKITELNDMIAKIQKCLTEPENSTEVRLPEVVQSDVTLPDVTLPDVTSEVVPSGVPSVEQPSNVPSGVPPSNVPQPIKLPSDVITSEVISSVVPVTVPTLEKEAAVAVAASQQKQPEVKPKVQPEVQSEKPSGETIVKPTVKPTEKPTETQTDKPIPQQEPIKTVSSDSITYITPQKIVYIFDPKTKKTHEYEGSIENKNLRETKLNESGNTIQINKDGKWVELSQTNFKELYPIINSTDYDEDYEPTNDFFTNMQSASVQVFKDIEQYMK